MKIGLVCPYNLNKGGGVQQCVLALHVGLKQRGHDAKIITPLSRDAKKLGSKDILYIGGAADIKSPFHTTAQVSVSVSNDAVESLLEQEQFDLLHFHEPWVPVLSRQILARSKCKNVATFHAKLPDTVMSKTIERVITPYTKSVLKYIQGLTAVSEAAAAYVRTLTAQPIHIVPNGIDLSAYEYIRSKQHDEKIIAKPLILYIGRLERRKGVKYLLKTFAQFVSMYPNARLVIAGDGPDRAKLEAYVSAQNISGVTFLGFVNEAQKKRLLSQAHLVCSPALFGESFGIILLEAMAAGVPLVAGNNPGYSSVMVGRGKLSLVDPKDTAECIRAFELLLFDTSLRKLWREWSDEYIQQFSYNHVVDAYEQIYQDLTKPS
jgi:phosphatidylinositol alpha-mannosyltransferase